MTAPIHAEQILSAIKTLLTGLTTTGTNVKRDRFYSFEETVNDALTIAMGADQPADQQNMAQFHSYLNVKIYAYTRITSGTDTRLNLIRDEVYTALMADRKLGLPTIVINTIPLSTQDPEESTEGSKPIARMELNYNIQYVYSVTDLGA